MALNIKDTETEKLAEEVAEMTGETKTEAVREALAEKKKRLEARRGGEGKSQKNLREFFETEIWPLLPQEELGKPPLTKEEEEEILGYDEEDE
ncbi:MAG TPA: type II toxin-antitoxin system VapB family antitoxin [Solirubrobacterales bacterium]|jgi:antitoxin VapB|nr:type II toxin-antitoxin system VapB family antitoxin [Solirubrobacterales bacterium]